MTVVVPRLPTSKVPQGAVSGRVFLADSHSPARGARILLLPAAALAAGNAAPANDLQMAVTALDGTFRVEHVAEGSYVVLALAAGYLSPIDGIDIHIDSADLDTKVVGKKILEKSPVVEVHGSQTAHTEFELQRGAVLAGRVLYSDGAPASQLPISYQKAGGADQTKTQHPDQIADAGVLLRTIFLQQRSSTDDEGQFRIAGIPPGKYSLSVVQNLAGGTNPEDSFAALFNPLGTVAGGLTVYSGNTLHRKDAKTWDLKAGDEVNEIEIILPLNGLHTVRGIATGGEGAPLNFGSVELTDATDAAIAFRATIEADGQFRFAGIPEGAYQLKATGAIYGGNLYGVPPGTLAEMAPEEIPKAIPGVKLERSFAPSTQSLTVGTADIDNLSVTLADAPLPAAPAPPAGAQSGNDASGIGVVVSGSQ